MEKIVDRETFVAEHSALTTLAKQLLNINGVWFKRLRNSLLIRERIATTDNPCQPRRLFIILRVESTRNYTETARACMRAWMCGRVMHGRRQEIPRRLLNCGKAAPASGELASCEATAPQSRSIFKQFSTDRALFPRKDLENLGHFFLLSSPIFAYSTRLPQMHQLRSPF